MAAEGSNHSCIRAGLRSAYKHRDNSVCNNLRIISKSPLVLLHDHSDTSTDSVERVAVT